MVFKLVRIDTETPSKIDLSIGKHVIGRGKFLHNDDTDKRVSRNHAELEVTEDNIILKSLHKNPCFYIKKTVSGTLLLHQDCTTSLSHGDRFGLIPDNFWYEVLYFTQDGASESMETNQNEVTNEQKQETNQNGVTNEPDQEMNENGVSDESVQNIVQNEIASDPDNNEVTSEANQNEDHTRINQIMVVEAENTNNTVETNNSINIDANRVEDETQSTQEYEAEVQTPTKRRLESTESSPVEEKKVKTEPANVKTEPDDTRASAGPSNRDQASSNADGTDGPASPKKPNVTLRERCIYGANCYRRNPQHKAQFSHPSDSDWGAGERGVCPYGEQCRRTDPRHWAAHDHPPGTQPRDNRPGKRQRRRKRSVSYSDDEEETPAKTLIVTGKRTRKPINLAILNGSESEGEEDPYKTDDECDEWQPPSDAASSQDYTQDF